MPWLACSRRNKRLPRRKSKRRGAEFLTGEIAKIPCVGSPTHREESPLFSFSFCFGELYGRMSPGCIRQVLTPVVPSLYRAGFACITQERLTREPFGSLLGNMKRKGVASINRGVCLLVALGCTWQSIAAFSKPMGRELFLRIIFQGALTKDMPSSDGSRRRTRLRMTYLYWNIVRPRLRLF